MEHAAWMDDNRTRRADGAYEADDYERNREYWDREEHGELTIADALQWLRFGTRITDDPEAGGALEDLYIDLTVMDAQRENDDKRT